MECVVGEVEVADVGGYGAESGWVERGQAAGGQV